MGMSSCSWGLLLVCRGFSESILNLIIQSHVSFLPQFLGPNYWDIVLPWEVLVRLKFTGAGSPSLRIAYLQHPSVFDLPREVIADLMMSIEPSLVSPIRPP